MARVTAAAVCLLLTLSGVTPSEPDESQPASSGTCPAVCTCHVTERSLVPLVRYQETGDTDHESDHHWHYYHGAQGLNHSADSDAETAGSGGDLVLSVVCALQHGTDTGRLLQQLPADTKFLSLLQAPDLEPTSISAEHFSGLTGLEGLEIHGFHAHAEYSQDRAAAAHLHGNDLASLLARADRARGLLEPSQPASARLALAADALRPLTRLSALSLEHVLLTPDASGVPVPAQYRVSGEGQAEPLLVAEQPELVPYEQFVLSAAPRYSTLAGLSSLQFLRLAHTGLEELQSPLLDALPALRHLRIEQQPVRTLPAGALSGCPALRHLSLAGCRLLSVDADSLSGLPQLETLDLSDNLISELSALSLAPLPGLRELSLAGNPVRTVLEGALDALNGTRRLQLGAADTPLQLRPRALRRLGALRELSLANVSAPALSGALLSQLPELRRLRLHGELRQLEFDAFSGTPLLEELDASRCQLEDISQDAFLGLTQLVVIDLSHNSLTSLAADTFSGLVSLRELYLHHNQLSWLSPHVLGGVRPKLLQLQHNPWECTCQLAFLSAAMTNKARSTHVTICQWDSSAPGGRSCHHEHRAHIHYDAALEPRCHHPEQFRHWGVYEVLQQQLRCRRPAAVGAAGAGVPAGVPRSQLHPEDEEVDYLTAPDAELVLLGDRAEQEEEEDYAAAAGIADEEAAMAEYSADEYDTLPDTPPEDALPEEQAEDVLAHEVSSEPELSAPELSEPELSEPEPAEPEYQTLPPELFAKLSKKAQKLERERMNPKFRKHYNL